MVGGELVIRENDSKIGLILSNHEHFPALRRVFIKGKIIIELDFIVTRLNLRKFPFPRLHLQVVL
jgi:hypothetical protein